MERRDVSTEVFLRWVKSSNMVFIVLNDLERQRRVQFAVEPDKAMDAFEHPFIYGQEAGMLDD
jgi:hypothetical protein